MPENDIVVKGDKPIIGTIIPPIRDYSIYMDDLLSDLAKINGLVQVYLPANNEKFGFVVGHPKNEPNLGDPALVNSAIYMMSPGNDPKYRTNCCITFETRDINLPNAVERMRIDGNGNVGIGTPSPLSKLDVYGDIRVNDKDIWLRGGTDKNHGIGWYGLGKLFANMNLDGPAVFGYSGGALGTTNNGQKVALKWGSDGNVGIGTISPSAKLNVDPQGKGGIVIGNPSTGSGGFTSLIMEISAASDGYSSLQSIRKSGSQWGDISLNPYAGNVGIGKTDPSAKLEVNGDIKAHDVFLVGGDCAEDFDIVEVESVQPGTVMVIDREGALRPSHHAYDKRVAGVISGAGDLHPGITLDRQKERANRLPIALNGKVYCKVDAEKSPIEVGDLLTTSSIIGHAMKADDRDKAFGAVIGKALHELEDGRGLIPILVALQ